MRNVDLPAGFHIARVVSDHSQGEVENYLPFNYRVVVDEDGLLIVGVDKAGWTMRDYVIPRLGSGLIVAREIHITEIK